MAPANEPTKQRRDDLLETIRQRELEPDESAAPRFNSLGIAETWSVTVEAEGQRVLCISHDHYAGPGEPELDQFAKTIDACGRHLIAFIGSGSTPEWIKYDAATDTVELHGFRYSGELFRDFAFGMNEGQEFRIVRRADGVIWIERVEQSSTAGAARQGGITSEENCAGDLTDEQWIFDLAADHEARGNGLFGPVTFDATGLVNFARAIERAAIAAHIAKEPKAEQQALSLIRYHHNECSKEMHDAPIGEYVKYDDVSAHLARQAQAGDGLFSKEWKDGYSEGFEAAKKLLAQVAPAGQAQTEPNRALMALIDLYSLIVHNGWCVPDESYHFITNAAAVIEAEVGTAPAPVAPAAQDQAEPIPDILFDGKEVYDEITRHLGRAHCFTADAVSTTLDAVVRLLRRGAKVAPAAPSPVEPAAWRKFLEDVCESSKDMNGSYWIPRAKALLAEVAPAGAQNAMLVQSLIEAGALRQYRHNNDVSPNPEFVFAYDKDATEGFIGHIVSQRVRAALKEAELGAQNAEAIRNQAKAEELRPPEFNRKTDETEHSLVWEIAKFSAPRQHGREFSESGLMMAVDFVRNQVLEDAAEICENNISPCCYTAESCAEDIRALKTGSANTVNGGE
jgi:hypothetical protein